MSSIVRSKADIYVEGSNAIERSGLGYAPSTLVIAMRRKRDNGYGVTVGYGLTEYIVIDNVSVCDLVYLNREGCGSKLVVIGLFCGNCYGVSAGLNDSVEACAACSAGRPSVLKLTESELAVTKTNSAYDRVVIDAAILNRAVVSIADGCGSLIDHNLNGNGCSCEVVIALGKRDNNIVLACVNDACDRIYKLCLTVRCTYAKDRVYVTLLVFSALLAVAVIDGDACRSLFDLIFYSCNRACECCVAPLVVICITECELNGVLACILAALVLGDAVVSTLGKNVTGCNNLTGIGLIRNGRNGNGLLFYGNGNGLGALLVIACRAYELSNELRGACVTNGGACVKYDSTCLIHPDPLAL